MGRINSWESLPFIDLIVIEVNENVRKCPSSHPEEFIFDVWPGITAKCDCLLREGERTFTLNHGCRKVEGGDDGGYGYRRLRYKAAKYHDT